MSKRRKTGRPVRSAEPKNAPPAQAPERERQQSAQDRFARSVFEHPLGRSARDAGAVQFFWRVAPTLAFGIALYVLLGNLGQVAGAVGTLMGALTPVFIGIVLAFILDIPMRMLEARVFFWVGYASIRRGLSVLVCYVLLLALVLTLVFVVFPQLSSALESLGGMLPVLGGEMYALAQRLVARYELDPELLTHLQVDWNAMAVGIIEWTTSSIPQLVSTTRNITSRVLEVFIGFVLSVYMLFGRERMARQAGRLCRALLRRDWADRVISICALAQTTFRGYVTGMLTEACILGALTALGMAILGFPSPAFTGMLMGVGALVPIFGIFSMVVVNSLLIAVQTDILTGLWFVVYITLLQQLEGNLIYPRVMGNAIRLPGVWVLAAVTVGGTLFGLTGLLLSIPIASMLYALARALVITREGRSQQRPHRAGQAAQGGEYVDISPRTGGDR